MLADVRVEGHEGTPVARIHGEIDLSNVSQLASAVQKSVEHVSAGVIVAFSETSYLDSAGLHFVFDLGKRLRDRGQRLYLVVPEASPVAAVLRIVNVDSLAPRCPDLESALERLRVHAANVPHAPA